MDLLGTISFVVLRGRRAQPQFNKGSSEFSTISVSCIHRIIEHLKMMKNRDSTKKNYLGIWRNFNKFIMRLDCPPDSWEECTILFCAHIIDKGLQSSMVKSYISAIKCMLKDDNYDWKEQQFQLTTLTHACWVVNDQVRVRRPIQIKLLEVMLFELQRILGDQPYLLVMYRAFFALSYYGFFRVGELALGDHPVKAMDVHIATNKPKMLFILHTSKSHGEEFQPQKVKITGHGTQGS